MYPWFENPTEVGRAANYSEKSFRASVYKLLAKANIHTPIHERLAEMKRAGNEVLLLLADPARENLQPLIKVSADSFLAFDLTRPDPVESMHLIDLSPCPDPNINVGSVFWGQVRCSS